MKKSNNKQLLEGKPRTIDNRHQESQISSFYTRGESNEEDEKQKKKKKKKQLNERGSEDIIGIIGFDL